MRAHLGAEGHTGIPSKNERIYDTLQEHGVLEPCGDRAIWRATVAGPGWSHDLTLIRIRAQRIWPQIENGPEPFEGSVIPQEASESDSIPATADDSATPHSGTFSRDGETSSGNPDSVASGADYVLAGLPLPDPAPTRSVTEASFTGRDSDAMASHLSVSGDPDHLSGVGPPARSRVK